MPNCTLTIATTIDGKETQISRKGEMTNLGDCLLLTYQEDGAKTTVTVGKDSAEITRKGDYSTYLPLKKGEKTQGSLGIAGSIGELWIQTYLAEYSQKTNKYLITLRYDILTEGDPQETRVRILVKTSV